MIFFFILITCVLDIVLVLKREILYCSLVGVKGLTYFFLLWTCKLMFINLNLLVKHMNNCKLVCYTWQCMIKWPPDPMPTSSTVVKTPQSMAGTLYSSDLCRPYSEKHCLKKLIILRAFIKRCENSWKKKLLYILCFLARLFWSLFVSWQKLGFFSCSC